jgi:pSer/pThr/pTyr-binding forkhead associated (FHA) protein
MSAQLVPLTRGSFPTIPLQRPVLLVGRHPDCDVRIDLPKISRRHCCVALAYERVMIRDLGSRNGLRVNGRLVDEAQLHEGDEVAIGPVLYRVESLASAARPGQAPPLPKRLPAPANPLSLPSLPVRAGDPGDDLIPLDLDL